MLLEKIKSFFNQDDNIPEPPYSYDFLYNLPEKEYPKYLKKIFKEMTGDDLDLKNPKTFNEKIQWLKIYDLTPLKTLLTDKVLVRDWVKERIGEKYLKEVVQVCKKFDDVNFDILPESFIIKTNHGCKWHFRVKDKQKLLNNEILMKILKRHFDGWMSQVFFPFAGLEMQYRDIPPQILVEPLLVTDKKDFPTEIEIYCFNGVPRIFQRIVYSEKRVCSVYDEKFNQIDLKFSNGYVVEIKEADDLIKKAVALSSKLASEFKLVRVDWLVFNNEIYFNEMTFTPFSGYYDFSDKVWNERLGKMLDLNKK